MFDLWLNQSVKRLAASLRFLRIQALRELFVFACLLCRQDRNEHMTCLGTSIIATLLKIIVGKNLPRFDFNLEEGTHANKEILESLTVIRQIQLV